ncbi:hypothetical protein B0181_06385 [Moraxella caviae]|uniref:Cell division protein n=1 Tax=Moraxella caviae TaxID=34060 RepID=A0A1T0A1N8_9GAMM|nr:cell division protein FtsL [Moraxella caviae]OOR89595.1 hypothetical protein B0181_06385 [Moraxella caviae]STZ10279.1 Cell division protein [Moraxella caviae]
MSKHRHATLIDDDTTTAKPSGMIGVLRLIVLLLLAAILWTGVSIAKQAQEHHAAYRELQKLGRELTALQVEEQRLLIEQQTFSSTPQVARRAVSELGMFFPVGSHRQVIAPTSSMDKAE